MENVYVPPTAPPPPPPPPAPKRRGVGFWIAVVLALFFFATSCLLALVVIGLLLGETNIVGEEKSAPKFAEVTLKGSGDNKILILPIVGEISDAPTRHGPFWRESIVDNVKDQLDQAEDDKHVRAVILDVNSPGGGITASDIIYRRIMDFKKRSGKPVVVCMRDVAASGAYYISVPADRIIAHPTTITGSIGVLMPLLNIAELAQRWGIRFETIKSGQMKDMGSMFRTLRPEERKLLQNIVNEMYDRFVTIVATHRALPKKRVKEIADGRIFTGEQAKALKLVDDVGYIEDAIETAKRLCRLKTARIIRYRRSAGWLDLLDLFASRSEPTRSLVHGIDGRRMSFLLPQYRWQPAPVE